MPDKIPTITPTAGSTYYFAELTQTGALKLTLATLIDIPIGGEAANEMTTGTTLPGTVVQGQLFLLTDVRKGDQMYVGVNNSNGDLSWETVYHSNEGVGKVADKGNIPSLFDNNGPFLKVPAFGTLPPGFDNNDHGGEFILVQNGQDKSANGLYINYPDPATGVPAFHIVVAIDNV